VSKKPSGRKSGGRGGAARASRKPPPKKSGKKAIAIIALLGGGVLIALGVLAGFLDGYGQINRARKADALVVLGAQVGRDGKAGRGLQMRALHAARLYKKGYAPHIICTGGVGDYPPSEAVAAAKVLLVQGVPRAAIFLEDKSTSTWENAANAARICKAHGWKRVVVVSDPFHLWRAERNFRKCGVPAWGAPVARELWRAQRARAFFWASREAVLVARDWCLRRV
jgi:uncharacterized SAM-binding protein YcdF (DUF218 family)